MGEFSNVIKNMKNKKINRIVFLLICVLITFVGCKSTEDILIKNLNSSNSENIIRSIDFVNNKEFSDKDLKKKLDFKVGDRFDTILMESGQFVISEAYRKKGYAEIEISIDKDELIEGKVVYIINEGPRFKIKTIKFVGNKIIKTSDLKTAIKTSTRKILFWPNYYTEEKIEADLERLRNVYYERGFLNYDIQALGRSNITFLIDEGPQYKIADINIANNSYFSDETLLEGLELKKGGVFYPLKAQIHARKILRKYREIGFVKANVETDYNFIDSDPNSIILDFSLEEGRQFRIGKIDITGNEQTQDKVVRQVLNEYDFAPGQLYNANMAPAQGGGELEQRVRAATLAEDVTITPVLPDEEGNEERLDAVVNLDEGLTGMWNPGVAFGSDNGFYGQLIWSQRNFDITDWPESFGEFITMQSFKGAGQQLYIELRPGVEVSTYLVEFTEPFFQGKPTSLNVSGQSWERWFISHDEKKKKAAFSLTNRYKNHWRTSLGFRAENVNVGGIDYDAPLEIWEYKGNNLLLGSRIGIGKDVTNDPYIPTSGYDVSLGYEQVTGDSDFGILEGSGTWYNTLYEDFRERKVVLATKILAGTTFSNAPFFEKYYAGGIGNYGLRGFEYRGVSTRGLQTNVLNPEYKDPIGSEWIFLANTELTVPLINDNVSMLFFLDSGAIDSGPYRASIGGGIQVMVPQFFGPVPIRFTLAAPLNKDDNDETQAFSFFMGKMF